MSLPTCVSTRSLRSANNLVRVIAEERGQRGVDDAVGMGLRRAAVRCRGGASTGWQVAQQRNGGGVPLVELGGQGDERRPHSDSSGTPHGVLRAHRPCTPRAFVFLRVSRADLPAAKPNSTGNPPSWGRVKPSFAASCRAPSPRRGGLSGSQSDRPL